MKVSERWGHTLEGQLIGSGKGRGRVEEKVKFQLGRRRSPVQRRKSSIAQAAFFWHFWFLGSNKPTFIPFCSSLQATIRIHGSGSFWRLYSCVRRRAIGTRAEMALGPLSHCVLAR